MFYNIKIFYKILMQPFLAYFITLKQQMLGDRLMHGKVEEMW